jgi:hypothetical protein
MAIKGNDFMNREVLCERHQSRIGIIHRNISIFYYERFDLYETTETGRDHGYGATQNKIDSSRLGFLGKIEEIENFCKDGFGRVNLSPKLAQPFNTVTVPGLPSINEGHPGARIQDHDLCHLEPLLTF